MWKPYDGTKIQKACWTSQVPEQRKKVKKNP